MVLRLYMMMKPDTRVEKINKNNQREETKKGGRAGLSTPLLFAFDTHQRTCTLCHFLIVSLLYFHFDAETTYGSVDSLQQLRINSATKKKKKKKSFQFCFFLLYFIPTRAG